jgi:hypothetical protein
VQKIEKFNINITKAMHGEVLPPRYACSFVGCLLKNIKHMVYDAPPSSSMDSLHVERWRQKKEKKLGCVPWLATLRG